MTESVCGGGCADDQGLVQEPQPRNSSGGWMRAAEPATNAPASTVLGIQAPILFLDPWNSRATQASCRSFLPVKLRSFRLTTADDSRVCSW